MFKRDGMKPLGLGTDIVHVPRIAALYRRHGGRALQRLLSAAERTLFQSHLDPIAFLSGRFAAKEAILKAVGCGYRPFGPAFSSIQILPDKLGKPEPSFLPPWKDYLQSLISDPSYWLLSISHERRYAVATALWSL